MASGAAKNEMLEQKRLCARVTFSQSLLVADGTFKLDYLIFIAAGAQIDEP